MRYIALALALLATPLAAQSHPGSARSWTMLAGSWGPLNDSSTMEAMHMAGMHGRRLTVAEAINQINRWCASEKKRDRSNCAAAHSQIATIKQRVASSQSARD